MITNVGPVHLELVETIENVARAKAELIDELRPGATAVVPEEPLLDPYLTRDDIEIVRVDQSRELPFATGYTAAHQLLNTRTALTVVEVLGLPLPEGELQVEFSKLREEEVPLPGGGLLLNDCYNANPVSMRAALAHLDERAGAHRRLAVLGEMAELGADAPAYHARDRRARTQHRRPGDRRRRARPRLRRRVGRDRRGGGRPASDRASPR